MTDKITLRDKFDYAARLDDDFIGLMMTFHLVPTVEVFNHVITSDPELYQEPNDISDRVNEFYIEYADEDWISRKQRIYYLKKELNAHKAKPAHKSNYMHPYKLAWVCAAFKQFPWLIDECARPLYIERAIKYVDNTVFHLTQRIAAADEKHQGKHDWFPLCEVFVQLNELMFGASGNHWYIDNMKKTIGYSCSSDYQCQRLIDEFGVRQSYYKSETYKVSEGTIDAATELIRKMIVEKEEPVEPVDPADDDVDELLRAV